eukprot:g19519.t1
MHARTTQSVPSCKFLKKKGQNTKSASSSRLEHLGCSEEQDASSAGDGNPTLAYTPGVCQRHHPSALPHLHVNRYFMFKLSRCCLLLLACSGFKTLRLNGEEEIGEVTSNLHGPLSLFI